MASVRYRDVFKVMCCKLGLLRPAVTVRQTGRKELPLAFERLEPRQLMSRTTLGGSFSIADDFVGPREKFMPVQSYSYGPQRATVGSVDFAQMGPFLPSVYSPPSGRESGFLPPPTPPVFPQPPGTPPTPPPTSPPSDSGNKLKVDIWGVGINTPKIMEGDDFDVNVRWEGDHSSSPKNVTVNIWADIDFDDMIDDGEMYSTQTAMPNGFVRHRWKALDDGPWPGNTTPRDELKVVVGVDLDPTHESAHRTGALVHNVKPMFKEPPKYKFGVDKGRDYVEVEVDFWDPGVKDLFKLTLETERSWTDFVVSYSSEWMAADSKGENTNYIKHRFYTERLDSLGEKFTLTVADDDSGLDRRWNLWQAVERNDNDSNSNSVVDLLERKLPSPDPEIVKLGGLWQVQPDWLHTDADLSVKHEQSAPRHLMLSSDGVLRLFYDPSVIRIWDSPKKEKLFAPYMGLQGEIGHTFTGLETLWIEGYNRGSTEVYATWKPNTPDYFVNEYMNRLVSHSFTVNVAGIDVDIDSDNDEGVNPNFERDDWNEYLEDSPYALGKLIGQNTRGPLLAYDSFVPMVIDLTSLPENSRSYSFLTFTCTNERVEFWKSDKTVLESERIFKGEPMRLSGFSKNKHGLITVWISLFTGSWSGRTGEVAIVKATDDLPRPDVIKVILSGENIDTRVTDSVQIRPVRRKNENMFAKDSLGEYPPALQSDPAVRSAGAAQTVYHDSSGTTKFAIKKLDAAEVEKLLRSDPFFSELDGLGEKEIKERLDYLRWLIGWLTVEVPGVTPKVVVYLDHCDSLETKSPEEGGGRYVIAFRGSTGLSEDWVTNVSQAWTGASNYHETALRIGFGLQEVKSFRWEFTGHSLGGGLAAAAAMNSNGKAITFNAAGVNPQIFLVPGQKDTKEYVKHGYKNYINSGRREQLIKAYVIEKSLPNNAGWSDCPDVLTWLQPMIIRVTGHGFEADGSRVQMEGLFNLDVGDRWSLDRIESRFKEFWDGNYHNRFTFNKFDPSTWLQFEDFLDAVVLGRSYVRGLHNMLIQSHKFPSLLYGLLHDDQLDWNAYDWRGRR